MAEILYLIKIVVLVLVIVVPLLVAVAYLTYAERKVIGYMQLRQGPMTVGPFGLLQPLARPAPTRSCSSWPPWSPSSWP